MVRKDPQFIDRIDRNDRKIRFCRCFGRSMPQSVLKEAVDKA
jgi:hypothetical protein